MLTLDFATDQAPLGAAHIGADYIGADYIGADYLEATALGAAAGVRLVPLHEGLWRVTLEEGEVLGYVESFAARDGQRFRAKRISPRLRRFLVIGEFWRMREAVECFTIG